jgi:hypothetical protein
MPARIGRRENSDRPFESISYSISSSSVIHRLANGVETVGQRSAWS